MASKIFISYRREDSIAIAGRLHDKLAEAFGYDNLFMDVDKIPIGINFDEYLKGQIAACDVVLAIIGPTWLNAKDETDQRRLDKPDDFVAFEIAAALAREIPVIPVLVDGTRMPKASELPASLKPFALRNAIQVRNTNFGSDATRLITKMREALALERPERTQELVQLSLMTFLAAAFLLNISVFLVALFFFFLTNGNNAGQLAALAAGLPISTVGQRLLARDESARKFGIVIAGGGLLAAAAILVSPQLFRVFDSPKMQHAGLLLGGSFLGALYVFVSWKKIATLVPKATANSPWRAGQLFLLSMLTVSGTWEILYWLTDSLAAALAMVGCQLLMLGACYVGYYQVLVAANPASAPS